ncbi:MAG: hypothetical protein HZA20_11220 [Nitrospirae bacterium]|nr:hypothetical protein [Nitrospirota bacterium]
MTVSIRNSMKWLPTAIWMIFAAVLAYKAISEAVFRVPVLIHPPSGWRFETGAADFVWNYTVGIPKKEQGFRIEIATDRDFKNIIKSVTTGSNEIKFGRDFMKPGPYYYRVRFEHDGKMRPWSGKIMFYGKGDA